MKWLKMFWWWALDELCALAADNLAPGNYEVQVRSDDHKYIVPRVVL